MNQYDYLSKKIIEIFNFDKNECILHYNLCEKIDSKLKIIIADSRNGFIIHQEVLGVLQLNINYYTKLIYEI